MKKYIASLSVTLLILVAVLLPGSKIPSVTIVGLDKAVHFILFFLWSLAIRNDFNPNYKWWLAWAIGALISGSTEVFQFFVEGRSFDLWDILFDILGLSVGLAMGNFALRILKSIFWKVASNQNRNGSQ